MKRFALGLEYNGAGYQGWQRQIGGVSTVQGALETALSKVADVTIRVVCAGRTDAGVHACEQIVHFESMADRSLAAWLMGTNNFLPKDIRVTWVAPVNSDFDARHSAIGRRYRYFIFNRRISPGVMHTHVSWIYRPLDVDKMHRVAQVLLGTHDFSSFRASACEAKTPVRTVSNIQVTELVPGLICIDISANAFLQHMVRNIAGVLIAIGAGKRPEDWIQQVLAERNRQAAGVTAPPGGLYFVKVFYKDSVELPSLKTPVGPWFALVHSESKVN